MGKASINADTPAIREIFTDGQNILLCQIANPQDLAKKILMLKNDQLLREKIAHNAYQLIQQTATSKVIGADLLNNLKQTLNYYDRRID
jgi:glycosyltransferase involved in cell wall biosynthesis